MSEFEQIHDELVSLGWTPEQGKGDHVKFNKPGNRQPITISRSLNSAGRSYKNTISNIRRQEPAFSFGKSSKSMEKAADKLNAEPGRDLRSLSDKERDAVMPFLFIEVGGAVRYSKPENFDYSKLADEGAVMNIMYIVREIVDGKGPQGFVVAGDRIRVSESNGSHVFEATVDDFDAWDLKECPECGRSFPVNRFQPVKDPLLPVWCDECLASARKRVTDATKGILDDIDVRQPFNRDGGFSALSPALERDLKKYGDVPMMFLPKELRDRVIEEAKSVSGKMGLTPAQKKGFEKKVRSLGINNITSKTPYECWMIYLRGVKTVVENSEMKKGTPKNRRDEMTKSIFNSSYTLDTLGSMTVVNIVAGSSSAAIAMIATSQHFYNSFDDIYPEKDYCMRVRHPKSGLDQYVSCIGVHRGIGAVLQKELDADDYSKHCTVVRILSQLCSYEEMDQKGNGVLDRLTDTGLLCADERGNMNVHGAFVRRLYEELPDGEHVDNVVPGVVVGQKRAFMDAFAMIPRLTFCFDDAGAPELATRFAEEGLRKALLAAAKDSLGDEVEVAVVPLSRGGDNDYEESCLLEPRKVYKHTFMKDVYLQLPFDLWTGLARKWDSPDDDTFIDKLLDVIRAYLDGYTPGENSDTSTKNESSTTLNTDCPMPEFSSLDAKNPTSTVEAFKDVTTRELLRELKSRGVQFEGLSVPVVVRQNVNLDEI